jgi:NRAMP (natural resistance-associated macrophage protein)-like metal ion transporter
MPGAKPVFSKVLPRWKKNLFLFLSIMGPGIITASADNDAGGIATYATVGASYGYEMLWVLFLITFSLCVVQEMNARMGAVTGKGLSDLIREQFGVKMTFLAMSVLLVANIATTIAEFAGIAASMEIFGISKYISVPIAAVVIWTLVVKGSYKKVERVFLGLCLVFITYVISGFLVHPPWGTIAQKTFTPSFQLESHYLLVFIGTIGTTITPWMQFFIQSSVVDKGVTLKDYKYIRADVLFGAFVTSFVAFFIIVATAATLHESGIQVNTVKDAAVALKPIAGQAASYLFAIGLFGASMLAGTVLPLSTAYAICEAFGLESGVNKRFDEAPVFFWLYTIVIVLGAGCVLIPDISLILVMLVSQDVNGILLPVILFFMLRLVNNKKLMGEYTNGPIFNIIAWGTAIALIILTCLLLVMTIYPVG